MAIPATIKYYGQFPSSIIFQTSDNFDGTTAQSSPPVITPGLYTFPPQSGGGLYNLHEQPILVRDITHKGAGTLSIYRNMVAAGPTTKSVLIGAIEGDGTLAGTMGSEVEIQVSPGEWLSFVSTGESGGALVSITASEALWALAL